MSVDLEKQLKRYPEIADLAKRAQSRIPQVAWEYLSAGTGDERARLRNLDKLAEITFLPTFLKGALVPEIHTHLLGHRYEAPFGMAPVGATGLMWPQAEHYLAATAKRHGIPYCLSTVAAEAPETVGPKAGEMGWFQLYPPREREMRQDLLKRVWESGFKTLVVTADVPAPSRRERIQRAGFARAQRLTPRFIWQGVTHPRWSLATVRHGLPKLKTVLPYMKASGIPDVTEFMKQKVGGTLSWDYLQELRDEWEGHLFLKGVLHPDDAHRALEHGVDALIVSNHGGRQFNAAPAAIEVLPIIVKAVAGHVPVLYDSGIRSGLDILRALALGAEFVLLGRGFIYGVAALGEYGGDLVVELLRQDLISNMINVGAASLEEVRALEPFTIGERAQA